ncbi:MAG TPA: GON domain-containing protein [Nannocystis sp.]|jgi:hypothetical protein
MNLVSRTLLSAAPWLLLACDIPDPSTDPAILAEDAADQAVLDAPDRLQDAPADPDESLSCILCVLGGNHPTCGADGKSHPNACFAACAGGGAVPREDYWPDADADGFGDASATPTSACKAPAGTADNDEDCDDTADQVFPGNAEACDGLDNDCMPATECDPVSCADIALEDPSAVDGSYTLHVGLDPARPWTAYCHDMAGDPASYLSLVAVGEGSNFSQYASTPTVHTEFSRVRIDPATLAVDIDDLTFSTSTGATYHDGEVVTQMPYGVAESCSELNGAANIDLTGTPFRIATPFCTGGNVATGGAILSADGQVADITGSGSCGWTSPSCTYAPHELNNGPVLELAYIDP